MVCKLCQPFALVNILKQLPSFASEMSSEAKITIFGEDGVLHFQKFQRQPTFPKMQLKCNKQCVMDFRGKLNSDWPAELLEMSLWPKNLIF